MSRADRARLCGHVKLSLLNSADYPEYPDRKVGARACATSRVVTCDVIESNCSRSVSTEQLIKPYLEGMHRTGTGLLEVRDFLRVKLDDLWLPVRKSSTSVRQRSGRCRHRARAATGCEQNGGNLTQLRHRLQPWLQALLTAGSVFANPCIQKVGTKFLGLRVLGWVFGFWD